MPDDLVYSSTADSVVKAATELLAIEKACQLIDGYVQEVRQQPPSPFNPVELRWPASERRA